MARLTSKARSSLPTSDFALPKSAGSGKPGKGSFPIPDASHARNALARVASKPPAMQATVKAKVASKFPGIQQGSKPAPQSAKPMARRPKGDGMSHDAILDMGHEGGKWK